MSKKIEVLPDSILNAKKTAETSAVKSTSKLASNKIVIILSALLVIAVAGGAYSYMKYRDISKNPKGAISEKNQAETSRVIDGLKKNILIGETDAPTVARVEDPEKLKKSNAEFYKDIQKGDYLVIFPKRAMIYRDTNDQIINVAPIINTADLKADKAATTPAATDKK